MQCILAKGAIMETIKTWIEKIYADNGLVPTVVMALVLVAVIGAAAYFGLDMATIVGWFQ